MHCLCKYKRCTLPSSPAPKSPTPPRITCALIMCARSLTHSVLEPVRCLWWWWCCIRRSSRVHNINVRIILQIKHNADRSDKRNRSICRVGVVDGFAFKCGETEADTIDTQAKHTCREQRAQYKGHKLQATCVCKCMCKGLCTECTQAPTISPQRATPLVCKLLVLEHFKHVRREHFARNVPLT